MDRRNSDPKSLVSLIPQAQSPGEDGDETSTGMVVAYDEIQGHSRRTNSTMEIDTLH